MKKIILFYSIILIAFSCENPNQNINPIETFQRNLVDQGITGSNVTKVFKDGEIVYNNITNSCITSPYKPLFDVPTKSAEA